MKYAVLGYRTINIGDDIQSFVASTLVDASYIVMRDNFDEVYDVQGGACTLQEPVKLIMNGWFMHNSDWRTGNDNIRFPYESEYITPVYASTCLCHEIPLLYSEESLRHYRKHEPVLCRDSTTLRLLQEKGVKAEFFGCLTQLLDVSNVPVNLDHKKKYAGSVIYIDAKKAYRKRRWGERAFFVKHYADALMSMNPSDRIRAAGDLLSKYRCAKKIYTERLHAFLPCRAMGLDVEYVGELNYRTKDLVATVPDRQDLERRFRAKLAA